jgi:acyl-CoA hydrolase
MPVAAKSNCDETAAAPGVRTCSNENFRRAVMSNPSRVYEEYFGGRWLNAMDDAAAQDTAGTAPRHLAGDVGKP